MSEKSLTAFANFKKKNVGKKCWVSQYYHGDNFVLIGDAAHPFRPIGQGFNIAMMDGIWLDQYIQTFPHDRAKALRKFGDYSKLQGDACIHLSPILRQPPKIVNQFVNYGLGIQHIPVIHVYLNDKDADYNTAWKIFEATDKMWLLFAQYFFIS